MHLFSQAQGSLRFDQQCAAFVPDTARQAVRCCGAANGVAQLASCLADGTRAAREAIAALEPGIEAINATATLPTVAADITCNAIQALWEVPPASGARVKSFVDFQNDVTADDVRLAARENYQSVEHLKRYTTMGMGTDQGRTSNVNALAIMAHSVACDIAQVGTTTFRPPYTPITLSALAGIEVGDNYMPVRRTPLHD